MRRVIRNLQAISALVLATWLLAAAPAASAPPLKHLNGMAAVKSWFNSGVGHPRMIFLFSPT